MDDVDFQILAALTRDPLASWSAIGRQLGVSPAAVARRFTRAVEVGACAGFLAAPDAGALGRTARVLVFPEVGADAALCAEVLAVDGVVWAAAKHNGALTVAVYDPPGAPDHSALVEVVGTEPVLMALPARRGTSEPSPLDWRIARALVFSPRATVTELATTTGLSRKTVEARRERLVGDGVVQVWPQLLGPADRGTLFFHLGVFADTVQTRDAAERALSECVTIERLDEPPALYLFCRAATLQDMMATERTVQRLGAAAKVDLPRHFAQARDRLIGWIDAKIAVWEGARRRSLSGHDVP